jgi:rhamnogalacturonan II specific xylosyltransferase
MRDFFPCQDHAIAARLRKEYRVTDFAIEDMNANNVTGLLTYGTKEYNVMMLSRTKHILRHLQSGENVIFTDVDTVWRKDPRPFLTGSAIDAWFQKERGEVACAGFFAMRSNKNTISFVKRWMAANSVMEHRQRGRRGIHDQDVLNRLFKRDHSMKRKFLAAALFPVGIFFFQMLSDIERLETVVVHFNWVGGYNNKKRKMQEYGMWLGDQGNFSRSQVMDPWDRRSCMSH